MKRLICLLLFLLFLSGCAFPAIAPGKHPDAELSGTFEVHYLDVGQADATLIQCDGEYLLLDGGDPSDSSLLYAYLKNLGATRLRYLICSHVHQDHIGGLAGALNFASADTVYCPTDSYDSEDFRNLQKYLACPITVPMPGDSFSLGSAECTILAVNTQPEDPNNSSIVLKVQYGNTVFLFSGDAEAPTEQWILDSGTDIACTVLKVPHHGSDTSLTDAWLSAANPQYAVISCGENNAYGHPAPSILKKLEQANIQFFRTDLHGHILCRSDGNSVTFEVQKNPQAEPISEDTAVGESGNYVVNLNTGVFHRVDCSSVSKILEKNRKDVAATREELVNQGFSPCGNCHP